ncbi:MAG: hypothetical protein RLZZ385_2284, partial [Pseudomonadota bacterium]
MRTFLAGLALTAAAAANAADTFPGEHGDIIITPLIHSSVQLEYQGTVIQIDPWDR